MSPKVYLVGAGPGDPELITMKAARLLAEAEVVVYDYLANPELLALAPERAENIYVGKKGGDHTKTQEQINALLCELAASGRMVVRLKGGDPFVFGRGGEEASALFMAGHEFEVVPGVTSAIAGPAYAGIPVTDRRHATDVAFVTGHEDPTKPESSINWGALAGMHTLVFLMGIKNLPNICAKLIEHGKPPDTPAACVRWGTTPEQVSIVGDLARLPEMAALAGIKPPAITVVGGVVSLKPELDWFEGLPLFGKRVLVTRTRNQASKLSMALRRLGALPVEVPTIEVLPPADLALLAEAVRNLAGYNLVMLTSANGVEALFAELAAQGKDARALAGCQVAAIGPVTAEALAQRGVRPDVTARVFKAEGLLEALAADDLKGKRVLLPRAEVAREVLPDTLREWGASVDVVPAYRTAEPLDSAELLADALDQGVDVITFTASSTVTNLLNLAGDELRQRLVKASQAGEITIASIGPITSDTARAAGLAVHLEPAAYTIEALVEALAQHFGGK